MGQQVIHLVNRKPYVHVPNTFEHADFLEKFIFVLTAICKKFDKFECTKIFNNEANDIWNLFTITYNHDIVKFFLALSQNQQEKLVTAMLE